MQTARRKPFASLNVWSLITGITVLVVIGFAATTLDLADQLSSTTDSDATLAVVPPITSDAAYATEQALQAEQERQRSHVHETAERIITSDELYALEASLMPAGVHTLRSPVQPTLPGIEMRRDARRDR